MWIRISGWQIYPLGMISSGIVTGCGGWHTRQRWRRLGCRLSASVGWRYTCSFASTVCLLNHCGAIFARKASGHVVVTKHSWVSFYRSLHLVMPRKLDTLLLVFSDLDGRFLDQILCFLNCGTERPLFGHVDHIQGQVHIGLFQLYPTSLPCHISRHVENLQEISCCFWQWDSTITSTMYASVASSKVI